MEPLHDGRYYDALHSFQVRDIDYWRALAGTVPRRILELACGTGRVAIPLARDGHDVVGIDLGDSMIAEARRKAGDLGVRFELADMREFDVGQFDLVIVPFNGMRLLLERADLERCLACVRRALAPGGRFALDVTMPAADQLVPQIPTKTMHHVDPITGTPIVATHVRRYDRVLQQITLDATFAFADGTTATDHVLQRVYFPQELVALLAYNGLRVVETYGDYNRSVLGAESPQLLYVASP